MIRLIRGASLALLLLLALTAGTAEAQRPLTVSVGGPSERWRPVVELGAILQRDRALVEALDSGLPLRFRFRIELWRKSGLFDQFVDAEELSRAVLRDPLEPGYVLEDRHRQWRLRTLAEADDALRAAHSLSLHPREPGRYYYIARLSVETLSLSDLDELRRWLRGEAQPAVVGRQTVGRAMGRGLRRALIRLLDLPARHYETRTPAFATR